MSRAQPLNLSPGQYATVQLHARAVPPGWRQRYLAAVQDQLMGLHRISDADVSLACTRVLKRMGSASAA
jgi:hypothetical protein